MRKLESDLHNDLLLINRTHLSQLVEVLKILEVCSKAFSRLDCNLLVAEKTLLFVSDKLTKCRTALATRMNRAIAERFENRRSYLAHILMYLETSKLNVISEKDVIFYIERLVRRLYPFTSSESELLSDSSIRSSISNSANCSLETELQKYIESPPATNDNDTDLEKLIKAELKGFKQTKIRGKFLQFSYEQIKQIKVSSVDVERVFSSLGLMITKFRSRLSDETIDHYLFLKHYFRNLEVYKADFQSLGFAF